MSTRTIVTMPGDGIGTTVLPEAIRVLDAVGFDAEYVHGDIGWEFWIKEGNPLPQRTIDLLTEHRVGLFGAITSKPKPQAAAELAPEWVHPLARCSLAELCSQDRSDFTT